MATSVKDNYFPGEQLSADDFNLVAQVINRGPTVFVNTKASANVTPLQPGTWVRVDVDENNNGDSTMYLFDGTKLEFQYTILKQTP